uniref:Uncharacterized protein n=1 Tax=Meloidogyne floridensis TaxID=298350 RepID=A0A915NUY6_9BILA
MYLGGFSLRETETVLNTWVTRKVVFTYPDTMSLLCAASKQCIEPDKSFINCSSNYNNVGDCHRYDQSVFGIINVNGEYQRSILSADKDFLPHNHGEHPKRKAKFSVQRYKKLDKNLDFKKGVDCCRP